MKNPKWHRDELILTLNLYYNLESKSFVSTNSEIINLSKILNKLPLHSNQSRNSDFRNPNGVAMKLSNFTSIDSNNPAKGLDRTSRLDKQIFFEFQNSRNLLTNISNVIIETLSDDDLSSKIYQIEEEPKTSIKEAVEGEILFKLHKLRERNQKLIDSKKQQILKQNGKLACEVCEFDFSKKYGEIGKGFIECHHTQQLSTYKINQKTTLDNLALVCSNCHRMLHRLPEDMSIERLKNQVS
ncbi:HNH endonuclease [Chryseobacterium luquanense]|uniref:HNH endonuclease n=1 Tax=Chryseobacterium luquanense TaxID=2983766 RepID=A0ABT3Y3G9_9FLAO|nr:HNH endonuclease [Chryseobacterium luquanense]MCX8532683.1 HNH endonuclease [Chryseobacterium luquanense]